MRAALLMASQKNTLAVWALLVGCWYGNIHIVTWLIHHTSIRVINGSGRKKVPKYFFHDIPFDDGLQVYQKGTLHFTPLTCSICRAWPDLVALLLTIPGINVNIGSPDTGPPLHCAVQRVYAVEHADQAIIVKLLLEAKDIAVNAYDAHGRTALHIAVAMPTVVLEALLHHPNINVNVRDLHDNTPLHFATDRRTSISPQQRHAIIELLLTVKDININVLNKSGSAPLHNIFSGEGFLWKTVQLLLAHRDCKTGIQDRDGNTILHYAVKASCSWLHWAVQESYCWHVQKALENTTVLV